MLTAMLQSIDAIDEKARLEALKNPRAKGTADMVRAINKAKSTRATPPTAPPMVVDADTDELERPRRVMINIPGHEATAKEATPWATRTSSVETADTMVASSRSGSSVEVEPLTRAARVKNKSARLNQAVEVESSITDIDPQLKLKRKENSGKRAGSMRVPAQAVVFAKDISRRAIAARSGGQVGKARVSFSSSAASNAVTATASDGAPINGDDATREAGSSPESKVESASDDEEEWDDVITKVMGSQEGYGFLPSGRVDTPLTPASLPGMPQDNEPGDTDGSKLAGEPGAVIKKRVSWPSLNPELPECAERVDVDGHQNAADKGVENGSDPGVLDKRKSIVAGPKSSGNPRNGPGGSGPEGVDGPVKDRPSRQSEGSGNQQGGRFSLGQITSALAISFNNYKDASGHGELEHVSCLQRWCVYLSWLWFALERRLSYGHAASAHQRHVVSILITPVKRLEREANKSSKRVHFKLRRKTEAVMFKPLHRGSYLIQVWLMGMVVPLIFDIFAFGIRVAFCDMYLRQNLFIWHIDIFCDVWKLADVAVALITVIPKHTYPRQVSDAVAS